MTMKRHFHKTRLDPWTSPESELLALRQREVILANQLDELEALQTNHVEVVPMIARAIKILAECRETINRFKVVHHL